jgi:hypothetical protein
MRATSVRPVPFRSVPYVRRASTCNESTCNDNDFQKNLFVYEQIVRLVFTYLCVFEFWDRQPHDETDGRIASSVGRVRSGRENERRFSFFVGLCFVSFVRRRVSGGRNTGGATNEGWVL